MVGTDSKPQQHVFQYRLALPRLPWNSARLAALSIGAGSLFSEGTLNRFNLSKGAAQHARDKLARMGHLQTVNGEWHLVDPLLGGWIVRLEARGTAGQAR